MLESAAAGPVAKHVRGNPSAVSSGATFFGDQFLEHNLRHHTFDATVAESRASTLARFDNDHSDESGHSLRFLHQKLALIKDFPEYLFCRR